MGSIQVKISVIIPAYNAEPYIAQTIESCLRQTRPPDEIIVVDDCSTDRTGEIAETFSQRVRVIKLPKNIGVSKASNCGVEASIGDWLAFLDHDDWFFPKKLEMFQQCSLENPNAVLIYSACRIRSADGSERDSRFVPPNQMDCRLRYACVIPTSSAVMLRREAFEAVGGFDPLYSGAQDWDMWLKIADRFSTAAFAAVPEPLVVFRRVAGSLSSGAVRQFSQYCEIVERRSLYGTSGLPRYLLHRKINAFQHFDIAIALRGEGSNKYLGYIIKSLVFWPFPGTMLPLARYKTVTIMLLQHLGWWHNSFRPNNISPESEPR